MRLWGFALALCGAVLPPAFAAEEDIAVDLKNCKFKHAAGVSGDLFGYNEGEERVFLYTNGTAEAGVDVPAEGDYEIIVKAACDSAQNERAKFKLAVDGQPVGKETLLTADEPKEYKFTAKLKAGKRTVGVEFTNDVHKEGEFDRNLFVHAVTLRKAK
jgi:Ca-dependent carbohydrate-binding module xylan-binding